MGGVSSVYLYIHTDTIACVIRMTQARAQHNRLNAAVTQVPVRRPLRGSAGAGHGADQWKQLCEREQIRGDLQTPRTARMSSAASMLTEMNRMPIRN
jgi:hypothetical protein